MFPVRSVRDGFPPGPGSYLRAYFASWSVYDTGDCHCEEVALQMEHEGYGWCVRNKSLLSQHLVKSAQKLARQDRPPLLNFLVTLGKTALSAGAIFAIDTALAYYIEDLECTPLLLNS